MYSPNGVPPVSNNGLNVSAYFPNRPKAEVPVCVDNGCAQRPTTNSTSCAPKTRINTCITTKYGIAEISFLLANWSCAPEVIPAHLHLWTVNVRNRGEYTVRARMKPIRADITGRAWFNLPEAFWRLGEGLYEFDFIIDNKCVLTQCINVIGVRPYLQDVGFNDPLIYCIPPDDAPQVEESPYMGELLSGDCNVEY
jgi:hypothetical protein